MSAAIRNRPRSGVRSRLVAVVALLVAGLVVLVVAPASTASAGRSRPPRWWFAALSSKAGTIGGS